MGATPEGDFAALVAAAHAAMVRRDWSTAFDNFRQARDAGVLDADDLYAFSDSAWWLGRVDDAITISEEAYERYLAASDHASAANTALGIGYTYMLRGNDAMASAWMGRGQEQFRQSPEGAGHGYLIYLDIEGALAASDADAAMELAARLREHAQRFPDPNLLALVASTEGRALIKAGRMTEGMARLDEAMLAARGTDLDPSWAGNIYCHMMAACHEVMDVRRAGEWTQAVAAWCEAMPGAGPFMGICRVHRIQVLEVWGDWDAAEAEARRVCDDPSPFYLAMVGEAQYEVGQLRRLRGDLSAAEAAYQRAREIGRDPQPGLALLRLQQGRAGAAASMLTAALEQQQIDRLARVRLLAAQVEVALQLGDLQTATSATEELEATAATYGTSGVRFAANAARGAVLRGGGDPGPAITSLRRALECCQEMQATYDGARLRLLLADCYSELGDHDTAGLERKAALDALQQLGAPAPSTRSEPATAGLTDRELEVLALVTEGKSNRQIADTLVLSVRTVERHLATIYEKWGLEGRQARTAAVSHALREGIVPAGADHSARH